MDNNEGKKNLVAFISFLSGLDDHLVPQEDAKDMQNGANYIPFEVTNLRREGEKVKYLGNDKWEHEGKIIT